jgi:mono/diheme cytochrome c family protein
MPCSSYCKILAADIVQLRGVVIVMAKTGARASQESVDRETQAALALDAHPTRGASQFARYCASCHGAGAVHKIMRDDGVVVD